MIEMNLAATRASSTPRTHPSHGVLLPKPTPSAASPSSSSSAAVAAAIFVRNNGGKETVIAKKTVAPAKKKLTCYCSPPPRAVRCPLHQFGSWPFRMLAAAPSSHSSPPTAAGSGDEPLTKKKKKKKGVVLPVVAGSNSLAFESFLQRKRQTKKPSRFFFEHEARVALEASNGGSE